MKLSILIQVAYMDLEEVNKKGMNGIKKQYRIFIVAVHNSDSIYLCVFEF